MRVTDRMMFQGAQTRMAAARSRAEQASAEASTGLRVVRPGDDPGASGAIVAHRANASQLDSLARIAEGAAAELDVADFALGEVENLLSRARELAVQLSNDTISASERTAAVAEVDELRNAVIANMNARFGERYVFGGNLDAAEPFSPAGAFVGDTGVRQVELAPGVRVNASVRGDTAITGAGGGVDVLTALSNLSAALTANNTTAIAATLTDLSSGSAQVSRVRAEAGTSAALLTASASAARTTRDADVGQIARLAEVDLFDAASRLALGQRALEAAASASARSFSFSLLDKLG